MIWFFERFPFLEVWVRIIYKKVLELGILKKRIIPNEKADGNKNVSIKLLDDYLCNMGLKEGDILIVHSSMKGIKGFGYSPNEIIDYLQNKVGKEGMLIMPTYPQYHEREVNNNFDEVYQEEYEYDVSKTLSWTGIITNEFMKRKDVIRSRFPNNTLAVWGNRKEILFKSELESDLAFDKKSVWNFCYEKNAKVLFLGIHAHHSLSEIHLAEDRMDEKWPIKGWYSEKKYRIVDGENIIYKKCRVRKKYWTKYLTEFSGCYRLRKAKLLKENSLEGICVSFVPDLKKLVDYVETCALKGDLLYFRIPHKFYKRIK